MNAIFLLLKQTIIKIGHVLSNVYVSMIMSRRPVSVPLRHLYISLTKGSQLVLLQAVGMKAHCQPDLRLRGPRLCTPAFSAQGQPAREGRTSRPLLRPRGPCVTFVSPPRPVPHCRNTRKSTKDKTFFFVVSRQTEAVFIAGWNQFALIRGLLLEEPEQSLFVLKDNKGRLQWFKKERESQFEFSQGILEDQYNSSYWLTYFPKAWVCVHV